MMSLRFNALLLTFLLIASQAFAQVIVTVDMKQMGPIHPVTGAVLPRVGKGTDATYSATASYNGKPTLHAEEKVIEEKWTYNVTHGPGVTGNPTETGMGNSVVFSKKSVYPGTYVINVMFKITFTIETPIKNAGQYVYVNGKQQFTKRYDGPYSGIGLATLNVTAGKFKIRLEPDDKCNETATNKRSRTRFGLGEKGDIIVEPETPGDTVVVTKISSSTADICTVAKQKFTLNNKPGSATITVTATVNGAIIPDEETIGITAIAPTGMAAISKRNDPAASFVGSGMYIKIRFEPKDVSFSNSTLGEGEATGTFNGSVITHPKNVWKLIGSDVVKGAEPDGEDHVFAYGLPLNTPAHTLTWNIPFGYYDNNNVVPVITNLHIAAFDGRGGCIITKFGMKAARVPNNVLNLLNAVKNNTPYMDDWQYYRLKGEN